MTPGEQMVWAARFAEVFGALEMGLDAQTAAITAANAASATVKALRDLARVDEVIFRGQAAGVVIQMIKQGYGP